MILTKVERLEEGDVLARDIFSADANILFRAGNRVTESNIDKLKSFGITNVYIKTEFDINLKDSDLVKKDVKKLAVNTAQKIVSSFYKESEDEKESLDETEVITLVSDIIEDIFSHDNLFVSLRDIRKLDDELFFHLTNVSILSITIAKMLEYNKEKLKILGLGAFLHDIGKVKIPDEILNKNGKLTDEEFAIMQTHAGYSYQILNKFDHLPKEVGIIAYQHHEKCNGLGYPLGLTGEDIHPFAKIVAISDVFDALQNNRVYRKGLQNQKVINILSDMAEQNELDGEIVSKIAKNFLPFPLGSRVELVNNKSDNHLEGVVISVKNNIKRPVVQIVEINRRSIDRDLSIDLAKEFSDFEIVEVI